VAGTAWVDARFYQIWVGPCGGRVSFNRVLGGDCDSLGGTSYGELSCRNEFVKFGVEFGLRELSPAWDRGVEPDTNGAIDCR
jgi:hypothetical protein